MSRCQFIDQRIWQAGEIDNRKDMIKLNLICYGELNSVGMTIYNICKVWVQTPTITKKI